MLLALITTLHVAVCIFLIVVVLLQSGKSADIAAAFGGAGSQTAFGPRGTATLLSRATTWSAILFMITSITLSVLAYRSPAGRSVLNDVKTNTTQQQKAPANTPAPAPQSPK